MLSKSDFMLFMKHKAWLYLKKNNPDLLPAVTDSLQSIFDKGLEFENLVENTFKNPVKIGFSKNSQSYFSMVPRTLRALNSGAQTVLQGRLEAGNLTCIFDVVEKNSNNGFNLIEIKSSTKVKNDHIIDLAFQKIVIESCGFKVSALFVIYVNNEYVRNGSIEASSIIKKEDVTDAVLKIETYVKEKIAEALNVCASAISPSLSPRFASPEYFSDWLKIYETLHPFQDKYSVFKLTRLNPELIGALEDKNIELISQITNDINLNNKQISQLKATIDGPTINIKEIKNFISEFKYPLYFLDYETFSSIIPPYNNTKPGQNIPFQYSLHILYENGQLIHKQYLHSESSDPRPWLLKKLQKDINQSGSVVSWYKLFETSRNTEMGEAFSDYKEFLEDLNLRMIDLIIPFQNDWYTHKDFFGSASIKKVLPVIAPGISYNALEIKEGESASREWFHIFIQNKNSFKKESVLENLKKYCFTDTLAMVEIYKHLVSKVKEQ